MCFPVWELDFCKEVVTTFARILLRATFKTEVRPTVATMTKSVFLVLNEIFPSIS
jgi:hypothetical protein